MRFAQSSGEWPGVSMTFREGRDNGGSVEAVATERDAKAGVRFGGPRRAEAADGGGFRPLGVESLGSGRSAEGRTLGGGMRLDIEVKGALLGATVETGLGCDGGLVKVGVFTEAFSGRGVTGKESRILCAFSFGRFDVSVNLKIVVSCGDITRTPSCW